MGPHVMPCRGALVLSVGVLAMTTRPAAGQAVPLPMNATQWSFVGGPWQQDAEGVITAPGNDADENLAFFTAAAYRDFEAEYEFRWDAMSTSAGFVFRAADARHYYVVDFPVVGQQYRAENFWATVSKVDDRGWREGLHMQPVHGVTSALRVWHKARIKVEGHEIRVWVDGRPLAPVRDDTYAAAGPIGLATYSAGWSGSAPRPKASFRNLRVQGTALAAPPWDPSVQPRRTWAPLGAFGGRAGTRLGRDADGTLLALGAVSGQGGEVMMMSRDRGRTWTPAEGYSGIPDRLGPGGRWETYSVEKRTGPFRFAVTRRTSQDKGQTWTDAEELGEGAMPPGYAVPDDANHELDGLLEMRNGTLLLYGYIAPRSPVVRQGGRYFVTQQARGMNYCMRSADGGNTWTGIHDLDGPPHDDSAMLIAKEALEVSMAETAEGRLMAFVRPHLATTMWESTSDDAGATWTPLTHGPFPMYASVHSMVSTQSGALLIGGRFPGLAVQLSQDGGMSWTCHTIDCAALWANGAMMEVEPDVVLFIYGGPDVPQVALRYQLLRVTAAGLEPVQ